jgi:hypothetical protein
VFMASSSWGLLQQGQSMPLSADFQIFSHETSSICEFLAAKA